MAVDKACPYCNNADSRVVRYSNFKHYWFRCTACGTMWRQNKLTYPLTGFLNFVEKVPIASKIARRVFPPYLKRQDAEEEAYQTYGKLFHMILDKTPRDEMFEVKRKRYLAEASDLLALMKKHSIDVSAMNVLDISGGPGTFAHFIRPHVKNIVVTEYGEGSVNAMAGYLNGIKVIHADINDVWTHEQTFDLMLYRSCLYFCSDFQKHLQDINTRLHPGGWMYICTTEPSLGNSLRWQYEDYTHNVLYSQQVVADTLEKNNFTVVDSGNTEFYSNFLKHYSLRDRIFHSYGIWNALFSGRPKNLDARAYWILARKNK